MLLCSCTQKVSSLNEMMTWLNDDANGYCNVREVDQLEYKLKFMPSSYFVLRELSVDPSLKKKDIDSLAGLYQNSLTFILTIKPKTKEQLDIVTTGVSDKEEFESKVEKLNFGMKEDLYLLKGDTRIYPDLVSMENDYGVTAGRNFMIVQYCAKCTPV